MSDKEIEDLLRQVRDMIPMTFDLNKEDLKFDTRSIYYKIYKCIIELREGNK